MRTSGYLAIGIACEILIVLLPALRFFILRKHERQRSDLMSDVFLVLACAVSFVLEVIVLQQLGKEIRYEKIYPTAVVDEIVMESTYRRVEFRQKISPTMKVLVIPLLILRSLRLSKLESYALPFVFFVGFLSIIAATTRYVILYIGIAGTTSSTISLREGIHLTQIWSTVEVVMACTAFCMPSFRLFSRNFRKADAGSGDRSGASGAGDSAVMQREEWDDWEMGVVGFPIAFESREQLRGAES
ncbi:hypothetical protein RUND412_010843 [Rhizina undulata]